MKLISSGLAAVPVVNSDQEVLGVVTETGVLGAIREGRDLTTTPATAAMVPPPIIAEADTPTEELVRMLMENCCSVVTVVRDGKYAGVVNRHLLMDIFTSPHYSRFASKDRKAPFLCL